MSFLFTRSLSDQIYEILREDIVTQKIKCGEKLNIRELKERFSISPTPIREALNRLQQENLVEYVTNVGARAICIDKKDVIEINDMCRIIECASIRLSMERTNPEIIANEMKTYIDGQERSLIENKKEDYFYFSDRCHDVFLKYTDNQRLSKMSQQVQGQANILLISKYQLMNSPKKNLDDHKQIYEAVKEQNIEKAVSSMERHHNNCKQILLNYW